MITYIKPSTRLSIALRSFYLIAFLATTFITNSFAADNSYLINNVAASASGKNPAQARINATNQARRNAFVILLGRMTIDQGFNDNITDDEVSDMVHSEQITNEKISGNKYSAVFNIAFSQEFVNSILTNKNIIKGGEKQESYLVFPIQITKKKSLLWEKNNDWKMEWSKAISKNNPVRFKLPLGDVDDISMVTTETLANSSFSDIETILNKYKTEAAIVSYFEFDEIENKANITLQTIRKFQKKQVRLNFVNVNHLKSQDLISKVIQKTIEHINNNKSFTNPEKNDVIIDVIVSNLGDWLAIKQRLESMDFVEQLNINSISKDLIQVSVKYDDSTGDIVTLFSKARLNLNRKDENRYTLSLD